MRRSLALAAALLALSLAAAPAAQSAQFGLTELSAGFSDQAGAVSMQAGAHPFAMSLSGAVQTEAGLPVEALKDVKIALPAGLAGSIVAAPRCSAAQFLAGESSGGECPDATAIGTAAVEYGLGATETKFEIVPLYNLDPPPGAAAKVGFLVEGGLVQVTSDVRLSPSPPYNLVALSPNISQAAFALKFRIDVWGVPAAAAHDPYRGKCLLPSGGSRCSSSHLSTPLAPLLTMPSSCAAPLAFTFEADSWQHPGAPYPFSETILTRGESGEPLGLGGCAGLRFAPTISAQPTSRAASSASGLDFSLDVEDEGLSNGKEGAAAASDTEKAVVTLPPGMTVNPSQAEGLAVCSRDQLKAETPSSPPGAGCPQAAKIGTVEVETPLLGSQVLKGSLYVAKPYENEAGDSLIALYVVIKDAALGILVKQPIRVEPDPRTGRLISIAEAMPQLPFSHFRLHFREGARSPLISPPGCGGFQTEAKLYPYSGGPPVTSTSAFQILSGPNNSPCPTGAAPFHPGFEAGTLNNAAGSYSPFVMHLTRKDGEQDMGKFSFVLPPGVVPKLAGIPYCSEAQIAQAKSRTGAHGGQEELDNPSCPAGSQIGRTVAGAGVGSQLTYVPGKLYLAGPYHGDPISAVAITPAVAGPFDAGTVVVREALRLNPVTYVGEVDGAASDPIPHILKGIPLNLRDLRVYADKPEFTLNPTSCEPFAATSTIWGDGTALEPLAPHLVGLSSRFQAAGCASLGFQPKLAIKLKGGTRRGKFPALKAVVTPRPDDANFAAAVVTLPHSAFLEQGHFGTICTRVQFAAAGGNGEACPAASQYGYARAWTPLLAEPLEGPVFLRSSNHNLPDLVVALHGLVDIDLDARIDSKHGGIRSTFEATPDAPVSRFILEMQGGKKGLIVNSTNLCQGKHRARAKITGQNGKLKEIEPLVRARCAKAHKRAHGHHRRRAVR